MGFIKDLLNNRKEIKLAKIAASVEKVDARQETKQTAFEHGIDPNASMWGGLSNMTSSLGQMGSSILGKGTNPTASAYAQNSLTGNNNIFIIILAVVAFMFLGKK